MKAKRYYWIKLGEAFFEDFSVRRLRKQKQGTELVLIYLKLLQRAAKNGGVLEYGHVEKSFGTEMTTVIGERACLIDRAVESLIAEGLCVVTGNEYFFVKAVEMTGSEGRTAGIMREARLHDKVSHCDRLVTRDLSHCDSIQEIETEKEKESETEPEIKTEAKKEIKAEAEPKQEKTAAADKRVCGRFANVFLTKEEDAALRAETKERYGTLIEDLSEYIASTGKSYRNHFATLLAWDKRKAEEQAEKAAQKPPKRYASSINSEDVKASMDADWEFIRRELARED